MGELIPPSPTHREFGDKRPLSEGGNSRDRESVGLQANGTLPKRFLHRSQRQMHSIGRRVTHEAKRLDGFVDGSVKGLNRRLHRTSSAPGKSDSPVILLERKGAEESRPRLPLCHGPDVFFEELSSILDTLPESVLYEDEPFEAQTSVLSPRHGGGTAAVLPATAVARAYSTEVETTSEGDKAAVGPVVDVCGDV